MTTAPETNRGAAPAARADGLAAWAEASGHRRGKRNAGGGSRFAFYGRVSTEDWQDPVTSRARQREQAEALVRGHGRIVAEFFDEGESRTVAWGRRPQAAALVAQLGGPGSGLGRDRGRGVRAGVLRQPVRHDGAVARALRCPAVDAGGGRPGRLRLRARRAGDDGAGAVVEAGGDPDQHPGADRDGGPGAGAGPLPRRASAVRVPSRRRRAAPEQGPRRLGAACPTAGAGSGDCPRGAVDLRAAAGKGIRWRGSRGR